MRQYKESELSKKQKGAKQLHINRQHVQHDHRKGLQQSKISNAPRNHDLNILLPFRTTKAGVFHLHNIKLQLWCMPKVSDVY